MRNSVKTAQMSLQEYRLRWLIHQEGEWRNIGEDVRTTLEAARAHFDEKSPGMFQGLAKTLSTTRDSEIRVYTVNRRVRDFPDEWNLSTPDRTVATICRFVARGQKGKWALIRMRTEDGTPPEGTDEIEIPPKGGIEAALNTTIREVRVYREAIAGVISTPPVKDDAKPTSIEPFVRYLQEHASDAEVFLMKTMAKYPVVIFGETHHRQMSWDFCRALIEHPDFSTIIGTIFLELPAHNQRRIEAFLANDTLDLEPVYQCLRDSWDIGWPDQGALDFVVAVWRVNQTLPEENRIRIILADVPLPYDQMQTEEDARRYRHQDRDRFMADRVAEFLDARKPEDRHALFIVGIGHTNLNARTAGFLLRQAYGPEAVYTISTHTVRQTNWGELFGRLRHGAFDAAFREIGHRPVGFPLKNSPFGAEPYDSSTIPGTYADSYDGYVYFGPLEDERWVNYPEGFYDEAFLPELDWRTRLFQGASLLEVRNVQDFTAFVNSLRRSLGTPMWDEAALGPVDAWWMTDAEIADWKRSKESQEP